MCAICPMFPFPFAAETGQFAAKTGQFAAKTGQFAAETGQFAGGGYIMGIVKY